VIFFSFLITPQKFNIVNLYFKGWGIKRDAGQQDTKKKKTVGVGRKESNRRMEEGCSPHCGVFPGWQRIR
jgi:hypothetical protein